MNIELSRAWIILVALSLATTVFAGLLTDSMPIFVLNVLLLAGVKCRIILADYLGLRAAPIFLSGFTAFLVGFLSIALLLYALPFAM